MHKLSSLGYEKWLNHVIASANVNNLRAFFANQFLCLHDKDCNRTSCFKELVKAFWDQLAILKEKTEKDYSEALRMLLTGYNKAVSPSAYSLHLMGTTFCSFRCI